MSGKAPIDDDTGVVLDRVRVAQHPRLTETDFVSESVMHMSGRYYGLVGGFIPLSKDLMS